MFPWPRKSKRDEGKGECSARVVLRYSLLQIPELAILVFVLLLVRPYLDMPPWLCWAIVALWVIKDVALFPFVWRAYVGGDAGRTHSMVGELGRARERLAPSGYVLVRGELWKAEVKDGNPAIEKGEAVRVRGIRGLTLIVEPENKTS